MSRETVQQKAARYLTEGRLTVGHVDGTGVILAVCRGEIGEYAVSHDPEHGFGCSCPARRECAHIAALQLVTAPVGARSTAAQAADGGRATDEPSDADPDVWAAVDAAAACAAVDQQLGDPFADLDISIPLQEGEPR